MSNIPPPFFVNHFRCVNSGVACSNLSFVQLIKKCRKLKDVRLANCSKISDASIVKLFKNCRDLESLDVSACGQISDMCFQTLRSKHTHIRLKCLIVNACEKVTKKRCHFALVVLYHIIAAHQCVFLS